MTLLCHQYTFFLEDNGQPFFRGRLYYTYLGDRNKLIDFKNGPYSNTLRILELLFNSNEYGRVLW